MQLEIGGSLIDELSAEYLFIHEELHGTPGRRLEDSIMKIDNLAQPLHGAPAPLRSSVLLVLRRRPLSRLDDHCHAAAPH